MGFYKSDLDAFLSEFAAHELPSGAAVTFGTQTIYCTLAELYSTLFCHGLRPAALDKAGLDELAEQYPDGSLNGNVLLRLLGFTQIVNIDVVAHTSLTRVHDLGTPLPKDMIGKFSLVLDGTTGSHVTDRQAMLANASRLLKLGGLVVHTSGQYLLNGGMPPLNPQLLTRFYEENGFEDISCIFCNSIHSNSSFRLEGDPRFPIVLNDLQQHILFFSAVKKREVPLSPAPVEWLYELMNRQGQPLDPALLSGKKIAIWGTSGNYVDEYQKLITAKKRDFEFWGFVDNDEHKWGMQLDGHLVHEPVALAESDVDLVLLATWWKWDVYAQLCRLLHGNPEAIRRTFEAYRTCFELRELKEDYATSYLARGHLTDAVRKLLAQAG